MSENVDSNLKENHSLEPKDDAKESIDETPSAKTDGGNEDWLNDPRIAFNQASGKWIFEDTDNGLEYEYNEIQGEWIPVVDEAAINLQQQAYMKEDEEPTSKRRPSEEAEDDDRDEEGKQDMDELTGGTDNAKHINKKAKKSKPRPKSVPEERRNKGIYISKLALDTTVEELEQVFSKFGLIAEDLKAPGTKRIKLYADTEGNLKGDALIVYFKPESVDLAVQMMDNAEQRIGQPETIIKVEPADFSHKTGTSNGEAKQPATVDLKNKKKLQKRYQKMNEKLADWDDDEIENARLKEVAKRWEKVVILKYVFTLEELAADPMAASDIKEDILAGCEAIGTVTNIIIYDAEPEGVVSVKFQNKDDAIECVKRMNGRFFGGQKLDASIYDGLERYKRAPKPGAATAGDNAAERDEEKRLQEFGNWLENQT